MVFALYRTNNDLENVLPLSKWMRIPLPLFATAAPEDPPGETGVNTDVLQS